MNSTATQTAPQSDEQLLDRVREGDHQAFEILFRGHFPDLLRFARCQTGSHAEAEDVVHDVFLRVWQNRARLGCNLSLRGYLLAAVRNRALDLSRRRTLQRRSLEPTGARVQLATAHRGAGSDSDPGAVAELSAAIGRAVDGLPDRCRTAFLLCRGQELTYAEAAAVMGVTPATVKTQVARALAALRISLNPFLTLLLVLLGRSI